MLGCILGGGACGHSVCGLISELKWSRQAAMVYDGVFLECVQINGPYSKEMKQLSEIICSHVPMEPGLVMTLHVVSWQMRFVV